MSSDFSNATYAAKNCSIPNISGSFYEHQHSDDTYFSAEDQDIECIDGPTSTALQHYREDNTLLKRLSNEACIKAYTNSIITTNLDVMLVSTYPNLSSPVLFAGTFSSSLLAFDQGMDS